MTQAIVFDVGGTNSRIALFEGKDIVWRDQVTTPAQQGPEAMLATMQQLHQPIAHIQAPIGVAIAGIVRQGCVFHSNPSIIKGWNDFPLQTELSRLFNTEVKLCNDARAAAWGEYVFGCGAPASQFLFITVSTAVGAGMVLGQKLYLTNNGLDGELGEMRTEHGCTLEDIASGSAIQQLALKNGFTSGKDLCDAADAGNLFAEKLYRIGIREIAKKVADLVLMLGIERVAIGGGLGLRAGYVERLCEEFAQVAGFTQCEILPATLRHDAGLQGMADLLLRDSVLA